MIDPDLTKYGLDRPLLAAIVVGSARFYGLLIIFPIFSLFSVVGILRVALAIGVSAPVIAFLDGQFRSQSPALIVLAGLALKELGAGLALGIALGMPFWAFQAAGDAIDVYRGANQANIFDQVNALETTPLGTILLSCAMMLFLTTDGFHALLDLAVRSYDVWLPAQFLPKTRALRLETFLDLVGAMFKTGLLFAVPLILLLGALELTLGFVGRSARQINLNDSIQTAKNAALVAGLVAYGFFVSLYVHDAWSSQVALLERLYESANGQR